MDTAMCVPKLTLLPLVLLAAGAALSGCGKSDSEAAADTVTAYLKAFGAGDGEEACERLTEETKRVIASRVAEKFGGSDCPDAIRGLRTRLSAAQADAFEEASATRVKVRGDAADVRFRAGQARGLAKLRKAGDGWKISLLPQAR
jgi:hypothetical protein